MNLRSLFCGLIAGTLLPGFLSAAVVGAPAAAVSTAPASAPLGPRIDAIFDKWDKTYSPGLILGVAQDGLTVYSRGYGMANLEHNVRMSPQIVSESGSVAKQFTAAAVVTLAVRGKLSLDDPIQKYLPEMPEVMKPITIRMLLNHTSGLRDIHGLFDLLGRPSYTSPHTNAEVLEVVSHQRDLNFTPGSEYLYSNTGFILLTVIVERVTGKSFPAFCAETLFKPHNLSNTSWRSDFTQLVPRRATGYAPGPNATFRIDSPYSDIYGNGGLLSTVGDWLAWNASFDSATGEWAQVVKLMQTPSKLTDGTVLTYGLGIISTQYRGLDEISHGGSTAGYRTFLVRFPSKHVSIALLANSADVNASELVHRVADVVLGLPKEPEPASVKMSEADLASHAGMFRDVGHDHLIKFLVKNGRLQVNGAPLVATGPDAFVLHPGGPTFLFDGAAAGKFQRVKVTTEKVTRDYAAITAVKPEAAKLADYVGDYFCPELDVTVPVTINVDKLMIRVKPEAAVAAQPTYVDGFENHMGLFTFDRSADGKVTSFSLTNEGGRCRRVVFARK